MAYGSREVRIMSDTEQKVVLSSRIDAKDMETAKRLADHHCRSVSGEIRYLIQKEANEVFGEDTK